MDGEEKLVLGGGHGVRAYLPSQFQRFSFDLDLYCNIEDIKTVKERFENRGFGYRGYGLFVEGRFKRFDAAFPDGLKRATIAFSRSYRQSFKLTSVPPEFFVTIENHIPVRDFVMRRPRSCIPMEYVKEDIPVLEPEAIIASKIAIIPIRPTADLYRDLFDIHALTNLSDYPISNPKIIRNLHMLSPKITETSIHERIKHASRDEEARRAVKLPKDGVAALNDWKDTTKKLRERVIELLKQAGCLC